MLIRLYSSVTNYGSLIFARILLFNKVTSHCNENLVGTDVHMTKDASVLDSLRLDPWKKRLSGFDLFDEVSVLVKMIL